MFPESGGILNGSANHSLFHGVFSWPSLHQVKLRIIVNELHMKG